MNKPGAHTPTPWKVNDIIYAASDLSEADARHIVKCVNSHDKLVMALMAVANGIWRDSERNAKGLAGGSFVVDLVESAIAALEN